MGEETEIGRKRMKEFYDLTHIMFTKPERLILYKILRDYKRRKDVTRLVMGLNLVLRTYTKLELLKYVRYFVWEGHLYQFDRLTRFHRRFRRRIEHDGKYNTFPADGISMASTSTNVSGSRQIKDVRVFTIHRERGEQNLGFSVRGGSEHGISIYVSDVDTGSAAEKSGLEMGDKILEVNNVSLRGVASSSAIKVLTGSKRLKLVVQRTRKVPEWRLSREKTAWYDVQSKAIISGDFEECGISNHIRGLDVDVPERRVNLKFGKTNKGLGFNVRGGREYGLGIYVSKVDTNGLAETNGVKAGDQIIDVNGVPFDNITHANAVEVLKGKRHLILTLRDVGRFPVFKELYAEYTWSDSLMKGGGTRSLTDIRVIQEDPPDLSASVADLFSTNKLSSSLHSEIFLPTTSSKHHQTGNEGSDGENDADSLIDLDQWAKEIQSPLEHDNPGFDYDEVPSTSADIYVANHKDHLKDIDIASRNSPDVCIEVHNENHVFNEHIEGDYDSPDMLYAKITKTNAAYESSTNLSIQGHDDKRDEHSDNDSQYALSERSLKVTENKLMIATDDATSVNTIDGALYSTERRLSGGSYKQLKNTAFGIYGSHISFGHEADNDVGSRESLNSGIHPDSDLNNKSYDITTSNNNRHDAVVNVFPYDIEAENINNGNDAVDQCDDDIGIEIEDDRNSVDMNTLEDRLKELQKRQESIGINELNNLDVPLSTEDAVPKGSVRKKGKWNSFKKKIKGSLRLKSPKRTSLRFQQTDDNSPGKSSKIKLWKGGKSVKIDSANMASLEETAKQLLDEDEFDAVIKHVKTYHETRHLVPLVDALLSLLDKPEKVMLLKDIRGVIYNYDLVRYDNMVNQYEIEAYQKLSLKLHLPLNHKPQKRPRRNLMTAELAEGGHFHIRPMEHTNKQRDVINMLTISKHEMNNPQNDADDDDTSSVLDHFEYLNLERVDEMTSVAAFSDYSHSSNEMDRVPGSIIVHLSKNKSFIGIDLVEEPVGGNNREVKITRIDPNGAANDDSTIEVGMILLGVDKHKVDGMSVDEVWAILDKSYSDKRHVSMKLVLLREESTNF
ncbi:PDZ domain containing [Mactra antiquata]